MFKFFNCAAFSVLNVLVPQKIICFIRNNERSINVTASRDRDFAVDRSREGRNGIGVGVAERHGGGTVGECASVTLSSIVTLL